MNTNPRPPTILYPTTSPEFQQLLKAHSENFCDRPFIFTALTDFLERRDRGYFTIVGSPGSGKSAILAKYATENPGVIYYNARVEGKNRAEQFLQTICTLLINQYLPSESYRPEATEGSWFLSRLLQKISEKLEQSERLIIAIDALDASDRDSQPAGSNLFYLPRYLPERVYFLLDRRPYLREKSGLLI